MSTEKIAVIGAGISGLVAAYTLQQAGFTPVVFEKESYVGGRMSSETVNGCVIDKGAYTVPEFYSGLKDLLMALGLRDQLLKTPSTSSTFCEGRAYDIKVGSPADILKYKLISTRNKINLMKIALYAKSLGKALDLSRPTEKSFELDRESAADYLLERYDEQLLERIAYPIFCEIFLGNPESNSKLAFFATLANLTQFSICAFENGMGSVPEYLAKDLSVRLDTPVTTIRKRPQGVFELIIGKEQSESFLCDAVILAAPLPGLADLIGDASGELKTALKAIAYAPSIVTAWGMAAQDKGGAMINNFLRNETKVLGTVVLDHLKGPGRVPRGKGLVTVILKEAASRRLFDASEDQIHRDVLNEMETVFPSFSNQVTFTKTYRWEHAAVQFPPGSLLKKQALRNVIEKELGGIYVAGDSLFKTSIETSLRTGIAAAEKVINAFG